MIRTMLAWVALLIAGSAQAQTIVFPVSSSESVITCDAMITDPGGFTNGYPTNCNGSLLLTPASSYTYIKLYFGDFNTSYPDELNVYDGADASAPLILRLRGDYPEDLIGEYGSIRATNPSGKLFLTFASDATPDLNASGFSMSASCVTPEITMEYGQSLFEQTCNATLYGQSMYMSDYEGALEVLAAATDKTMKISFSEFDVKPLDTLYVYDGSESGLLLAKYTGTVLPPYIIASEATRRLTLVLKAKAGTLESGLSHFRAHATCTDPVIPIPTLDMPVTGRETADGCGIFIYDSGGPTGNYSTFENGAVTLYPSVAGKKVKVEVKKMKLGLNTMLYIRDGINASASIREFCTGTNIPPSVTATNASGAITLDLHSYDQVGEGFEIFASCVTPVSAVSVSPSSVTAQVGQTIQLTKTISPADAGEDVTWYSSDVEIAEVSSTGLVTAKSEGWTTIILRTSDWRVQASVSVQVKPIAVTGISVSPSSATVATGNTLELTATILPVDAANQNLTWASSNTSTATVSSEGLVIGISEGDVTITATTEDGGFIATATITIAPINVTAIEVTPALATISEGATLQLASRISPLNASNQDVTWLSSDPSIAAVNATGLVTGVAEGTANISATSVDGDFVASALITVARTTGLSNADNTAGVILYPNPAGNILRIENASAGTVLRIFNLEGVEVVSEILQPHKEIDLHTLSNGAYTIKLTMQGKTSVQKLMIYK